MSEDLFEAGLELCSLLTSLEHTLPREDWSSCSSNCFMQSSSSLASLSSSFREVRLGDTGKSSRSWQTILTTGEAQASYLQQKGSCRIFLVETSLSQPREVE